MGSASHRPGRGSKPPSGTISSVPEDVRGQRSCRQSHHCSLQLTVVYSFTVVILSHDTHVCIVRSQLLEHALQGVMCRREREVAVHNCCFSLRSWSTLWFCRRHYRAVHKPAHRRFVCVAPTQPAHGIVAGKDCLRHVRGQTAGRRAAGRGPVGHHLARDEACGRLGGRAGLAFLQ